MKSIRSASFFLYFRKYCLLLARIQVINTSFRIYSSIYFPFHLSALDPLILGRYRKLGRSVADTDRTIRQVDHQDITLRNPITPTRR